MCTCRIVCTGCVHRLCALVGLCAQVVCTCRVVSTGCVHLLHMVYAFIGLVEFCWGHCVIPLLVGMYDCRGS